MIDRIILIAFCFFLAGEMLGQEDTSVKLTNTEIRTLYLLNDSVISYAKFKCLNSEEIKSIEIIKSKDSISKYSNGPFDQIINVKIKNICDLESNSLFKTKDEVISKTIEAINKRNTKKYIALFDFDLILKIWEEIGEVDKDTDFLDGFKNNYADIIKGVSMSYNMVIGKIEKVYKITDYNFDLIKYELIKIEKAPNHSTEKYKVYIKDNYNNDWSLDIYIAKYKDCYLIMEPIEYNYLEKID